MSNVHPMLPRLTVNAGFIREFVSAGAPCFALGLVEERKQQRGFLALRTSQPIPADVTRGGFRFGHTLLGTGEYSVIQFIFEFYDFATFNVLLNPNNAVVRKVLSNMVKGGEYCFFAINLDGTATAFQSGLEQRTWLACAQTSPSSRVQRQRRSNMTAPSSGSTAHPGAARLPARLGVPRQPRLPRSVERPPLTYAAIN